MRLIRMPVGVRLAALHALEMLADGCETVCDGVVDAGGSATLLAVLCIKSTSHVTCPVHARTNVNHAAPKERAAVTDAHLLER